MIKPFRGTPLNTSQPLARGMKACFPMNEGVGNKFYDVSGNGYHALLMDMTKNRWVGEVGGSAIESDDASGSMPTYPFGKLSSTAKTYTICCLIQSTYSGTDKYLFDSQIPGADRIIFAWNSTTTGKIAYYNESTWYNFGDAPNDGLRHLLVLVLDDNAGEAKLYVDGVQFGTTKAYVGKDLGMGNWVYLRTIGGFPARTELFYLWERALSLSDIRRLKNDPYQMFRPLSSSHPAYFYTPPVPTFDHMKHRDVLKLLFPADIEGDSDADMELEGNYLDDVYERASDFLTEIFPDEALELLGDWERVTGLPDDCIGVEADPVKRRNNILSRIAGYGGLSIPYFISLADNLGFTITIKEYKLFRVGMSGMGDYIRDPGFQFLWEVTVSGDYSKLECIFNKLKPAHTKVVFVEP